ncbi:hypothetical protein LINPERPRIM_LOCUS36667 [Linum perenne]
MEEQMLVTCMRELVDERHVEKGNFKLSALKALERMMHTRLEGCQLLAVPHIKSKVRYFKDKFAALLELKQASGFGWDETRGCVVADDDVFNGWSHPKASGLNNKPLPFWDDLVFIFGNELPTGGDAVQPADAASRVQTRVGLSDGVGAEGEQVDSYIMEDLLNQGIDMHATRLKDVEAEITSKAAGTKGKASGTSSGSKRSRQLFTDDDRLRLAGTMASASDNLARIANNYCIEGDLAVRRQYLYQELSTFPDLTFGQRTRIMRHLNRDDGDATTYFQLPTSEEKLAFVWNFLQ